MDSGGSEGEFGIQAGGLKTMEAMEWPEGGSGVGGRITMNTG
jgi:hypothetical protein